MKRYFFIIAYRGSEFAGWQRQENAITVQQKIEDSLSRLYNKEVLITGCGRTDTGVHAKEYYFHVDLDPKKYNEEELLYKLNGLCGKSIIFKNAIEVPPGSHARFDAITRSYTYHLVFYKDVFRPALVFEYDQAEMPDFDKTRQAAEILMQYDAFFPFCKTRSDVNNYNCKLINSAWERIENGEWVYHIKANRFLRGMVRLIVGMCLNVGSGRIEIDQVKQCLNDQKRLPRPWSVPAHGLYLTGIEYPYIEKLERDILVY